MSPLHPGRRVVLNFHGIGEPPSEVPRDEHPFWCPRHEWPALVEAMAAASGPGSSVEITFDDGNDSDVEEALPALVEHGLTATFHVCAGRLGQRGYLGEDALLHLRRAGMRVGSHGWDHDDLRTLAGQDLVRAARASRDRISEVCGVPVSTFAVPFGSYDRRVLSHLRDYATVYTSDATRGADGAWLVPRWSYVRGWTPTTVRDLAQRDETLRHRWRQRAAMSVKRVR